MGDVLFQFLLFLLAIVFFPLAVYISYCLRFYINQGRILYWPNLPFDIKSRDRDIPHEEIWLRTADGLSLSAWYVPALEEEIGTEKDAGRENSTEKFVILFCHGNVGNISQRIDTFKIFRDLGLSTFIFDYRGYGSSQGRPTEKGTYLDAEAAWNWLLHEMGIKPENIIIFGRSLGGGVASYLAAKFRSRALVIESSFTSTVDVAARHFPLLPVNLLTRFKYETAKRLKEIACPVLIIHSPDDDAIPYEHGLKLYQTANPPKHFLRIRGNHYHGFLNSGSRYVKGLKEFIDSLESER
jgi:pimeloyl-ACP methyl ester carboxylesterase